MAVLLPEGKQSFTTASGLPLVGGKLYTYDAGTSTPRPTYSDAAGTVPNTNPVILDARGEATVFWAGAYKVVLADASDSVIWTIDGMATPETAGSAAALQARLASTASGDGTTLLGSEDAGGYWAGTTQEAINQEAGALLVNIRSMPGVDVTGAADSYSALIAAFARSNYVLIPAGCTISLDTMWEPAQGQVLWMGPNTVLKRRAAAASTNPVVWMHRSSICIYGSGASSRILSEKACPQGVIRIGAADMTTPIGNDMFWCGLKGLSIEGSVANEGTGEYGQTGANPDIGILINAPQIDSPGATVIGIQASYFHNFEDLVLKKLNYGITFMGYANANRGSNIHFERLGNPTVRGRGFDFRGCEGNVFTNCWHHYAKDSDGIYSNTTVANTVTYTPFGNQVLNFCSEAGANARMYNLINAAWTRIGGMDFSGLASVNSGTLNRIETHKISREPGPLTIEAGDAGSFPLMIQMFAGQTGVPLIVRDSSAVTKAKIEVDGTFTGAGLRAQAASTGVAATTTIGGTTASTVGAAGAASALPANPLGYIIAHVGTTQVKIPYYNN